MRTLAALLMMTTSALALENITSYWMYADGVCDDGEHIPMWNGPQMRWFGSEGARFHIEQQGMPARDLMVLGAVLQTEFHNQVDGQGANSCALSGIAGGGGDVLNQLVCSAATTSVMFPAGFAMPLPSGDIGSNHIDLHIWCPTQPGAWWLARLVIYTVPKGP